MLAISHQQQPIVIVGAGIAGLSAACDLCRLGYRVIVLERLPQAGGRMRQVEVAGEAVDSGPTVLTMKWVFDELFRDAGYCFDEWVPNHPSTILGRHLWGKDFIFDLYADEASNAQNIKAFFGSTESQGYLAFCNYSRQLWQQTHQTFVLNQKPSLWQCLSLMLHRTMPSLLAIDIFRSMQQALNTFFKEEKLRQLFGRYATYCGGSPYQTPATLNLIAHVEQQGVYLLEGGMYKLAQGLTLLAQVLGAQIFYNQEVKSLCRQDGRIQSVQLANGEVLPAQAVIWAGDHGELRRAVKSMLVPQGTSGVCLSALTWSVHTPLLSWPLLRHNVLFGDPKQYRNEFQSIFKQQRISDDPTLYICAQDRDEQGNYIGRSTLEEQASERLLILINAPSTLEDPSQAPQEQKAEQPWQTLLNKSLARHQLQLPNQAQSVQSSPQLFKTLFSGSKAALYGQPPHAWYAFLKRPSQSPAIAGLYLAGGSVHPGPGVPMVAISGRLAAAKLHKDFPLTSPLRQVVMPGGISTPRAIASSTH